MTSFRLGIKPTRRAAGRFVSKARKKLQQAAIRGAQKGISQSDVARIIGVHRSLISRELNGEANLSLSRFAEIAQALGGEAEIDIRFPEDEKGRNIPAEPAMTTTVSTSWAKPVVFSTSEGRPLVDALPAAWVKA
jgi:transcriptional regulator with XRE-family HTH domain